MKEYKTIRINPNEEELALKRYETFGWHLEDTREVYNESQEIVGVSETSKVTSYGGGFFGGFMKGFTGNDGKIDNQINVQTRTNVTHYLSMRFSRDMSMPNYVKLKELDDEYENSIKRYGSHYDLPKKPIIITVISSLALFLIIMSLFQLALGIVPATWEILVCVLVPIAAILAIIISWVRYSKNKKKTIALNQDIDTRNAKLDNHINEVVKQALELI